MAILSFAIEVRSSLLPATDKLVNGVLNALLPPLIEPSGVEVPVPVVVLSSPPFTFDACFAAFSARRFCFEAEGAIVWV